MVRLGRVIYWECCVAAVAVPLPSFALGIEDLASGDNGSGAMDPWFHLLSGIGLAVLFYLIGRGFRLVLAGK